MSFALPPLYFSPFRQVESNPNHVCGFCGTKTDVRYAYEVESSARYPEASRCDATSVYSCSSCTLKRTYNINIPSHEYSYDFDLDDPYKVMSTLQRMYSDMNNIKKKFHAKWEYCYGCNKYVLVENCDESSENGLAVLRCNDCDSIVRYLEEEN